jgi:SHAQKYF class myb-like DNA-binding protein
MDTTMISPFPFVAAEPKLDPSTASTVDDAVHILVVNGWHLPQDPGFHHDAEFFAEAFGYDGEHTVHSEVQPSLSGPRSPVNSTDVGLDEFYQAPHANCQNSPAPAAEPTPACAHCSAQPHPKSSSSSPKPETVKMESKAKKRAVPWSNEEHQQFVVALKRFNGDDQSLAPGVAEIIAITLGTRSPALVRSHAQKHFAKLRKTGHGGLAR